MSTLRGRNGRNLMLKGVALLALATWPALAMAADAGSIVSNLSRGGAGLRVGTWEVYGLETPPTGRSWETVCVEGYFQKGLDQHLAVESTIGFWQRDLQTTEPGAVTGQINSNMQTYLIPTMSALKIYPMGHSSSPLQPYLLGGVGFVLGIEREQVSSSDPLVQSGEFNALQTGLGLQSGGGIEWNTGGPFGLALGARYQWASFAKEVGGKSMYRGPGITGGVTYRFTP